MQLCINSKLSPGKAGALWLTPQGPLFLWRDIQGGFGDVNMLYLIESSGYKYVFHPLQIFSINNTNF